MDSSGRDLQRLCLGAKSQNEINRKMREWLEHADTVSKADSYLKDLYVESDFRVAFNCLLNSYHATKRSVEKFLNHRFYNIERFKKQGKHQDNDSTIPTIPQHISPFILYNQDLKVTTALHVAVYRNSLHADKIAKLLLNWDRSSNEYLASDEETTVVSLASIPMICGSYPLHILTGQNLTINEDLLETLLYADSSIPFKDDVNGDNPISLLWKNTLRFRWAISVMEGATFIDYIDNNDCSWIAVITPHQFIEFSLLMAGAALRNQKKSGNTSRTSVNKIHDLYRIPRCPPMLLRLLRSPEYNALFGVHGTAYTFDDHGMLPIHHAVQNPPVTYKFVPSSLKLHREKSLVEMLLEENPGGVRVADDTGRLPLHYALDIGCLLERDLLALIRLYPGSLRIRDPITGLLPFMLASINHKRTATYNSPNSSVTEVKEEKISSSLLNTSESVVSRMASAAGRCQAEWKRDHLETSYLLLMMCPDAM